MIHLGLQTEYSFKKCFGHTEEIVKHEADLGKSHVGIADLGNTFGHIQFAKACKKYKIKPIFGARINILPEDNRNRTCHLPSVIIAKNNKGLQELYEIVKQSYDQFYYIPRVSSCIDSDNLYILSPFNSDGEYLNEGTRFLEGKGLVEGIEVPIIENNFINVQDREVYELMAGRTHRGDQYFHNFDSKVTPQHILSDAEYKMEYGTFDSTLMIAEECTAEIPTAPMVTYSGRRTVESLCKLGIKKRKINWTEEYEARYQRELKLIKDKGYDDYFLITSDMITYAKRHMLVGPSRGSSAGSLVCYLMGITEIDPIPYGLIFERFIDINRFDLPDIDVDFPDVKRKKVLKYLTEKYGQDNVMTLANIVRFKPKSAIDEFAAGLGIPKYETDAVKGAIIERLSGDARAAMCIDDTFDTTEPGKDFIAKYPAMRLVSRIEGHASHSGKHAAGVIVSSEKLTTYCGTNTRDQVCMLDKKDAESIGLLKIDCLGLRTLSILEEAAKLSGMKTPSVYDIPLDDQKTFDIFNGMRLSGVFQFEGYALHSLTRQMGVHHFNDIVAITSLARPGALNSGGASRYVKYHTGQDTPRYHGEIHKSLTEETYGITIYQEQMMEIARGIGLLSWEDTSTLRKAASKSLGDEFFSKFKEKFIAGAKSQGVNDEDTNNAWEDIAHCGSWIFNKSHAVSYGLISYWTAWFKANHPLEFSVASLNNARDSEHAVKLLRDMVDNDGIEYDAVIPEVSGVKWTVYDGRLIGGLTNIRGIAESKAKQIIEARQGKAKMTPGLFKMLESPVTDFDIIFPTRHHWGKLYSDPMSYGLDVKPNMIEDINDEGEYTFIGRLVDHNLRDLNEYTFLVKRGGEIIEDNNLYLNFTVEDDTDSIRCTINRWKFKELGGKKIAEEGKDGEGWYLIKGKIRGGWRKIEVNQVINLDEALGDIT